MNNIEFKILDNGGYEINEENMEKLITDIMDYQKFVKEADKRMRSANEVLKKRLAMIDEKQDRIEALEDLVDKMTAEIKSQERTVEMYSDMLSHLLHSQNFLNE